VSSDIAMWNHSSPFDAAALADRVRGSVAKKVLDWAEILPEFNGGFVHRLQEIRRHQRERSKAAFERSRPPARTEVRYKSCLLAELFPVEELDTVLKAFRRLFPGRGFGRDRLEGFGEQATSLVGRGYYRVGVLARHKPFLITDPVAIISDLPPEVDLVSIWLHKTLPSNFVVSFDVSLNEQATVEIEKLRNRMYLSTVRFRRWIPLGMMAGGYSVGTPEKAMEEAVLGWLSDFRCRLERVIRSYFFGFFSKQTGLRGPRLPSIEVLQLYGAPTEDDEFEKWLEQSSNWGECIGLHRATFAFNGYKRTNKVFVFSDQARSDIAIGNRLIFLHTPDKTAPEPNGAELLAIEEAIDTVLPFVVFLEFLTTIRKTVETLRVRVYRRLAQNRFLKGFRRDIRLHNHLQRQSLLFSRFRAEFTQNENDLKRHSSELKSFDKLLRHRPEQKNMSDAVFSYIENHLKLLTEHIELVSNAFLDHLSSRNMELTYRLQRQMFVWTIVVTLATVLGLVASWPAIKEFFHGLLASYWR